MTILITKKGKEYTAEFEDIQGEPAPRGVSNDPYRSIGIAIWNLVQDVKAGAKHGLEINVPKIKLQKGITIKEIHIH